LHRLIESDVRIERLTARPLSVALLEPFVIASGRVDATRAVEIDVVVATSRGRSTDRAHGLGEAACLPPVTREDQADVLESIESASRQLAAGRTFGDVLASLGPVARAGLEVAVADALSRAAGVALRTWLGGPSGPASLETDVTIAIASPEKMGDLARAWVARGFRSLKVKVGKDPDSDVRALEAIGRAAPGAGLRIDANAGYTADQAIAVARACERLGLRVECWEQPCAAEDLDGMAAVAAALETPVVADESVRTPADVDEIARRRCADGVNLKLAKTGSLERCVEMGRRAREAGLRVMVGGMVETRLGMTAAAHVACAVGGVDFVDLDTAWLLADDPYVGGYAADGPHYTLADRPGLDVARRTPVT
jgi:L-alanine-DL-glutamate epimerase-like enolase superfamily enzyme